MVVSYTVAVSYDIVVLLNYTGKCSLQETSYGVIQNINILYASHLFFN